MDTRRRYGWTIPHVVWPTWDDQRAGLGEPVPLQQPAGNDGNPWDVAPYPHQGEDPRAKPDTRLLVNVSASATLDLSQRVTNLTASGAGAYELTSTRTQLSTPGCIEAVISINDTDTGIVVQHGDTTGASYGYRVILDTVGGIDLYSDAGLIANVAVPGIGGTRVDVLVQWSWTANPLTTGAADAIMSVLSVCNLATGVYESSAWVVARATHAALPTSAAEHLTIGGYWNGATLSSVIDGTISWVRVGVRFHDSIEAKQDFAGDDDMPAAIGEIGCEMLSIPSAQGWVEDDEFAGPQYALACARHTALARRTESPLWRWTTRTPVAWEDDPRDQASVVDAWISDLPDDQTFYASVAFVCRAVPSVLCSHARVTINVMNYMIAGTVPKLEIRAYSCAANPITKPDAKRYYVTLTVQSDDGSTLPGRNRAFPQLLKIARDASGYSWLFLAFRVDGGTANADARFKILSGCFDPVSVDPSAGAPEQDEQIGLSP